MFSFPDPVNETSARLVAGGVVLLGVAAIVSGWAWLVARVITPRLHVPARYVPGPPKRFAQAIGATVTVAAAVLGFGLEAAADVLPAIVIVAAALESFFALYLGCKIFAMLMRAGVVPAEMCESCNDIRPVVER